MAFVRLSPAEFSSAGRAALLARFDQEDGNREPRRRAAVQRPRRTASEPAIEADLEWDERPTA